MPKSSFKLLNSERGGWNYIIYMPTNSLKDDRNIYGWRKGDQQEVRDHLAGLIQGMKGVGRDLSINFGNYNEVVG